MPMDLHHRATLAGAIDEAFQAVAKRYGARLEGLPEDVNEHSDFWQEVAQQALEDSGRGLVGRSEEKPA